MNKAALHFIRRAYVTFETKLGGLRTKIALKTVSNDLGRFIELYLFGNGNLAKGDSWKVPNHLDSKDYEF